MFRRSLAVLTLALAIPAIATGQQPSKESGLVAMTEVAAASLKWGPLELPGFAPGLEIAVIHGDPAAEGLYTIRLRFPADYKFPAHNHPNAENLTVVSGTFLLGMGEKTDAAGLKKYVPGDFLWIPGAMSHFGGVEGETIIQLHGIGPFGVTVTEGPAAEAKKKM
jgi:quercetin dioxygenase-like cupin family protein